MSGLIGRIKEESNKTWTSHPTGTFKNAVCIDVKEKEINGSLLYEIHFQTEKGKCKASFWRRSESDIPVIAQKTGKTMKEAEDLYISTMGRLVRLYKDLGLPPPEAEEIKEFEYQCYGRLGELVGLVADLEIRKNEKDPRNPNVFINKPDRPGRAEAKPEGSSESGPMDIDSIPF